MSNFLAIATVTAALQQLLQDPVKNAVAGAKVGFSRPNAGGGSQPLVNVYLYQVTPNAAYRNADLPTRRSDGTVVRKPQAALDLHYLFTFQGSDDKLEPQRMLGAVTRTLQAQPLLSTQNIQAVTTPFPFLAGSGLDTQVERVKFTPTALNLEEFSKLWSAFFQVEYRLSMAYQASVVLIESDDTPQEGLPVQSRDILVTTFLRPTITQVSPATGANQPILPGSTLLIRGSQLYSDLVLVRIGDQTFTPPDITDTRITLPLPASVPAGVQGVQVVQQFALGRPAKPHNGIVSNIAAIVVHPVITPIAITPSHISVNVNPMARKNQRITMLLNEATLPAPLNPAAYSFEMPPLPADTGSLTFAIGGVKGGGTKYFIRVAVDGAESPLDLKPASLTYGPTVTMP